MSYRVVTHLQEKAVSVSSACRVLGVSRAGYYADRRALPGAPKLRQRAHVKAAFAASGASYGSRRLMHAFRAQGIKIGRQRVRTVMQEAGLRATWKRKFVATTDSKHDQPVAKNVLDRQFDVPQANRAWVSDITYIRTAQGWLYLAVVLDLYSRKVVGWAMSCQRWKWRYSSVGRRGGWCSIRIEAQYASAEYQAMLARHGIVCSMGRKGNCWDNSPIERFFLNLKMERMWQRRYANHAEARRDITQYIVCFYNPVRLHSTLGYVSPAAYEAKSAAKQPISLSEKT